MKVCRTCRHWSDKHKGVCTLLHHGAGQFWMCPEWLEITNNAAKPRPNGEPDAVQPG